MNKWAGLVLAIAVPACGPTPEDQKLLAAEANTAFAQTSKGETRVGKSMFGGLELASETASGASIAVDCGTEITSIYVDTLRPADRAPPLHGAFGRFTVDGKPLPPTEMGWAASPKSAWTVHERNPVRPLARQIAAAQQVSFIPPNGGPAVVWNLNLQAEDRTRIKDACKP